MSADNGESCCMIVIFRRFDIVFIAGALKMPNGGEHGVFEEEEEHPGAVYSELDVSETEEEVPYDTAVHGLLK